MTRCRATITGIAAELPDYILNNDELSKMVDTSDEWIMTRIGIKERRIIKEKGRGPSDLGAEAVNQLLRKTGTRPSEIDLVICATVTPDHPFPATANLISHKAGIKNGFSFDLNAGCSGFLYALSTAQQFIETGYAKKIVVLGAEKMSSIVNYQDRATCPIFGDAAGAILVEPTNEDTGIIDSRLRSDGAGFPHLHQKAGGSANPASHKTVDDREHYIYQEGRHVFKWAVSKMADVSLEIMDRNGLEQEDIAWLIPHQANMRIIEAVARRMCLDKSKVMINIEKYGNTTAATLPLCIWEWEKRLKKGDNIILTTFGAGFTWGAMYLKWGYDGD
jgi:3-oxoacyl-[acyl-carrier-protein] synthase III